MEKAAVISIFVAIACMALSNYFGGSLIVMSVAIVFAVLAVIMIKVAK